MARQASRLHLLTVREVQTAGDGDHADGGNLILRVRNGNASWVFRYTSSAGKRREMGLGPLHRGNATQAGRSVTDARETADNARKQLRQGVDPIDAREKQRDEDRLREAAKRAQKAQQHLTLARAARAYHERAIEPRLTTKHAAQWIASLENHVPAALWNAPIGSIGAPALLDALDKIRSMETQDARVPETLRRIRQRLDCVFEDAIFHGHCTTNPAAAIRRKMRETLPANKAGKFAALPYKDAPAFFAHLRKAPGIAARCLEFAILTAARTNEALSIEWSEVDLEDGLWSIPAGKMKAKESHVVYLSARVLEIVKAQRGLDKRYVFPSPMSPDRPMSNMALLSVLDRLGFRSKTTVHGLCRATFSTWANETAVARPDVIEACLAHREADRVKAAYNRAQFSEARRALLLAWSDYLTSPTASNIIELRAA